MAYLGPVPLSTLRSPRRPGALPRGFGVYALLALCTLAAVAGGVFAPDGPAALVLPFALGGIGAAGIALLAAGRYPHATFGLCNGVTLLRGALTVSLLVPLIGGAPGGWAVAAVAGFALSLDGVDGWAARRFGHVSAFGARFDMEVDSLLALVLALHAAAAGIVPPAMLALGGARYAFVAAQRVWPWLTGPLPERFSRKAVCVVQIGTLIALQAPVLPDALAAALALGATAAVLLSFAADIRHLKQARA